jgi:hypothetical protein
MAHLVQVGAGSGGMVVLDLVAREESVTKITLIEPDIYKPHNVHRHYFPPSACGRLKAELAAEWVRQRRPDIEIDLLPVDLTAADAETAIKQAIAAADLGVCAVDNEAAKFHWDALMREQRKAWTLGEVLSGGIGGFVHWFHPDGPCYGCVASFLQRSVTVEKPTTPDYSQPGGAVPETTVPAPAAAIHAIASLHAVLTLRLLDQPTAAQEADFSTLLLSLQRVPDLFEEAFRPHKFRIARLENCLFCQPPVSPLPAENLDAALDQALARLGGP